MLASQTRSLCYKNCCTAHQHYIALCNCSVHFCEMQYNGMYHTTLQLCDFSVLQCNSMYCSAVHSEPVMAVLELLPAAGPPDGGPVEDVEEQEEHREDDEEGQVCHLVHIVK